MNTTRPEIVSEINALRARTREWRRADETIALVPTMGALHDGHLALVDHAKAIAKRTVVSIFVNPKQFAPTEDFATYPRTFESDCEKLAQRDVDVVWAPTPQIMYPDAFATTITLNGPALGLETEFRPAFFSGVATVCCKLLCQVQPDFAIFGEKDYQQLLVVQRMAADLDLDVNIVGHATVREADGLAMSSRNAYLSERERAIAAQMYQVLGSMGAALAGGVQPDVAEAEARQALIVAGFDKVDYVAVRDRATLQPWRPAQGGAARILAAAWLGQTRLIDNIPVSI